MSDQLKSEHVLVIVDKVDCGDLTLDNVPAKKTYIQL